MKRNIATSEQLALFGNCQINGLSSVLTAALNEKSGAIRFGLLPTAGKSGPSMKSVSGCTGGELAAYAAKQAHGLMVLESQQFNSLVASGRYTGGSVTRTKSGSWNFKLKPARMTVVAEVTEEAALAKLGITAQQLALLKPAVKG